MLQDSSRTYSVLKARIRDDTSHDIAVSEQIGWSAARHFQTQLAILHTQLLDI